MDATLCETTKILSEAGEAQTRVLFAATGEYGETAVRFERWHDACIAHASRSKRQGRDKEEHVQKMSELILKKIAKCERS
jgi:hypothetical protein